MTTLVMESASTLREMVAKLNSEECQVLRSWLDDRIRLLRNRPFIEMPIDELPLSDKAHIILRKENMKTVKDIITRGLDGIYLIKGIGHVTLKEIRNCIEKRLPNAFVNSLPEIPWDIQLRE